MLGGVCISEMLSPFGGLSSLIGDEGGVGILFAGCFGVSEVED